MQEYEGAELIPFTKRITGTAETNVFLCPYGVGIRLRLVKLIIYNEGAALVTVKIFDHNATTAVTDPPADGDATTPKIQFSVTSGTTTDGTKILGHNEPTELVFRQGMAVVCSAANVQVFAVVTEV